MERIPLQLDINANSDNTTQRISYVAVGNLASGNTQGDVGAAVGINAGNLTQGSAIVAFDLNAGQNPNI